MTQLYSLTIKDGAFHFWPILDEAVEHVLPVKWIGQNTVRTDDDLSKSDCGPACVAMWLGYRGLTVSVDDVSRVTGKAPGYTYTIFADLDKAANYYGLDLVHQLGTLTLSLIKSEIDARRPAIALAHYPSLPERFDTKYALSHWILIIGYDGETFFYNDPYWPTEFDGATIPISAAQLLKALQNVAINGNTPMQGAIEKVQ